jgi:DNA-binding response OmpR family regulator
MENPVLVVNADPVAARALITSLRAAGLHAHPAISASAATVAARAKLFQTAVIVASLSDMTWQQAVRDLHHAAPHMWLLVVTEGPVEKMTQMAHDLGADGVLPSPVDVARLTERLRALSVHRRPTF